MLSSSADCGCSIRPALATGLGCLLRWMDCSFLRRRGAITAAPVLLIIAALMAGCASRGSIVIDQPDGSRITVMQPSDGVQPATAAIGADGAVVASTGNQQLETPALRAAGQAWVLYLCGAGLILLGVVALAVKASPWGMALAIPTTAGTTSMLAGGGLIVVAYAAISIPWWAYAGAAVVALVIVAPSWLATKKDKAKIPTAPTGAGEST